MWTDKACFMHEGTVIVHKVTSVYEIILMLAVNVCIKSSSGSMFELVVANTLSWSPVCYLTHASSSMTLSSSVKCSTGAALRCASSCVRGRQRESEQCQDNQVPAHKGKMSGFGRT